MPLLPRKTALLLSSLAAALAFAGCAPKDASAPTTVKIGNLASITGKDASFGQSSTKATRLAIDEINAAGGVLGQQIELIFEDTQSKPGEAAMVVKKLVTRDHVVALIGEVISSRSIEAASVAQTLKIPMLTPTATNPAVTATGDYIFRACFIDPFQGKVLAKFARDDLGSKRAAVLTSTSSSYSTGLSKVFVEQYTEAGGEVVADQKFAEGDKDFKAALTAIRAANPDVIFVPAYYTEASLIAKQARELGITVPLLGGDGWEAPELFEIAGDAVEGCYYSTHFSADSTDPKLQAFVARYRARYDGATPDCMAALGYDAAYLLVDALRRAGSTDPVKIKDALAATRGFEGITGRIDMGPDRNASKPATILKIQNRKPVYVKTIAP
ncbi:ABC transporter substrate-binding protein [Rariglobus hedericola]|nr:ABC transporter substrate-binding protein [Rariglobus hedericola]